MNRRRGKRISAAVCGLVLAALMVFLAGCTSAKKEEEPGAGDYYVWYLESSGAELTKKRFHTDADTTEKVAADLLEQMFAVQEDGGMQPVFQDGVSVSSASMEKGVLSVDFNKRYNSMDPSREVLCRVALAKTLTAVEGIDYVLVSCDGQPLQDRSGNAVGAFSASDFVDSITNVNSYERVKLKLYFANSDGTQLVQEERDAVHNTGTSQARLVVDQLLAGSENGNGDVLPRDLKVLNVTVTNGTCYVNLDSAFLNSTLNAADYIPVYALVNSLTELKTVTKVQIMVGGSADVTYHSISFEEPFTRNDEYVQK